MHKLIADNALFYVKNEKQLYKEQRRLSHTE
jgi:hypothetical protein